MYIIVEIAKFLGALLATGAAIVGVYHDDTKSVASGKLTKKGRTVVSFAIAGLVVAAVAQLVQVIDDQRSAEGIRQRNEETAQRLERIPRLLARQSFPLEPVELFYTVEIKMDEPGLKEYSERLRRDIVAYLKRAREGRGSTDESLANEGVLFIISNKAEWLPEREKEAQAYRDMMDDFTMFHFRETKESTAAVLTLFSTPSSLEGAIVSMKRFGDLEQKVEVRADFSRRVLIKRVRCKNPVRTGDDVTSFSSLDLIGRKVRWELGDQISSKANLTHFAMRFSYDYGFSQRYEQLPAGREITLDGQKDFIIVDQNVGLATLASPKT